jgi:PKD repeat protein
VFKFRVYGLTCVLMVLTSLSVSATTIVLPTDEQLIAKSSVIVEGTVVSSNVVDRNGAIRTETTIEVSRHIKGETPATIVVDELGGILGDRITKVFGTPEFTEGERVLLFLEAAPRGNYRTIDLFVGKFDEAKTMNGRRLWYRDDAGHDVTLLDPDFRPLEATNIQRDAAAFDSFIDERLAGRAGLKNYGIENPVLARETAGTGRFAPRANFTLIDEPNIYRWFAFEKGQQVNWYSSGTQPGYSNGGVAELQTAMASWTTYGAALIRYAYAGARNGGAGGLNNPNGVNEVLFNDPLNEISGTWDKNKGGVVGQGGFNGVSSSQKFTAKFAADPTHPAGVISAWNITEGNLTIQDNVAPGNGMNSSRLAEIVAHEFGHTLGFGHSAESNALMYYSVTGLGPHLRNDDQIAARWLYPNGNVEGPGGPVAPAAPGNVSAVASGSNIDVTWSDNSGDEEAFTIYVDGNAVANAARNATSIRLSGLAVGTYSIHVVAVNGTLRSLNSNSVTVSVLPSTPVASFTVSPDSGAIGQTFFFNSTSTGTIDSLTWDFGDGVTTSGATTAHPYKAAGQYTVTLTVRGAGKTVSATRTIRVNGPLVSSFLFSPATPSVNQLVTFSDQSTGGATSWIWDFGDGSTSSAQNPSKAYATAGNYLVTLTAFRGTESSSGTRVVTVSGGTVPVTPAVVAAFDASNETPATGANVTFTDRSVGNPAQWSWNFGDGTSSNQRNPVHAFAAPGMYNITLTASNASSSSIATKLIQVGPVSATSYRTLVSAVAQTAGIGNTLWRTELSVLNAGAQPANITFIFIPSAGGTVVTRSLFLGSRQSKTYANALVDLFGIPSGAGALTIEANADLRVTSRTFTTGATGTYGQAVPDVFPETLERTSYITGIAANDAFRTNIGFVNRDAAPVNATLTLLNKLGNTVGTKSVTIAANSYQQASLNSYFPAVDGGAYEVLTMRIVAASQNAISAFGSVVDNRTQDPVYIQAAVPSGGNSLTIPGVGRTPGANGTFWRSDVTIFNPSSTTAALTLTFNNFVQTVFIGGNDTEVLADVLSRFGRTSGSGTLKVEWTSTTGPVVTSRTYTSVEGGGSYGQSVEPVAAFGNRMYVPGLRHDNGYRTNIGFVNGGSESETITVTLLSPLGVELGKTTLRVDPNQQVQHGSAALFPNANLANGFTLHVQGDANAQVFAYGSMVDNRSGDPVFFAGR